MGSESNSTGALLGGLMAIGMASKGQLRPLVAAYVARTMPIISYAEKLATALRWALMPAQGCVAEYGAAVMPEFGTWLMGRMEELDGEMPDRKEAEECLTELTVLYIMRLLQEDDKKKQRALAAVRRAEALQSSLKMRRV